MELVRFPFPLTLVIRERGLGADRAALQKEPLASSQIPADRNGHPSRRRGRSQPQPGLTGGAMLGGDTGREAGP